MNLTEFLLARIAEDEEGARRVQSELEASMDGYKDIPDATPEGIFRGQLWAHYDGQTRSRNFAKGQYISKVAAPSRVLAECAAKRTVIDESLNDAAWIDQEAACCHTAEQIRRGLCPLIGAGTPAIRSLAAVYKDHPDYQQEWAA